MRIGSLFSGTGALDMAVEAVFPGAVPAWFCEWDDAPSKILAHHWPDVPNYRDVSSVDWEAVQPVDIITGGFPCQDVSHAGRRQGLIRDGEGRTRSGLWGQMLRAIDTIRPPLVVAENVRGLLSAQADSDVEPCPWCMGDDGAGSMRALGAVLADLADIGYDAAWCGLRAADVGAAHGRFRVFILAWPSTGDAPSSTRRGSQSDGVGTPSRSAAEPREPVGATAETVTLLPTPRATDGTKGGPNQRGSSGDLMLPSAVQLLPTPAVNDMGASYTPEEWDEWTARMKAAHGNGNGHGKSLSIEAQRLLPTPVTTDANTASPADLNRNSPGLRAIPSLLPTPVADNSRGLVSDSTEFQSLPNEVTYRWGEYADAIARWETVIGRAAPDPTEPGTKGRPRLSPLFVEWLMGLPAGHVTDPAIGLTRNQQLKALGNGVVPLQCATALDHLMEVSLCHR